MEQIVQYHTLEQRLNTPSEGLIQIPSLYLPPAELVSLSRFHSFEVDGEMKWEKRSLSNRTCILGPNGVQTLIVPVLSTRGKSVPIRDIQICYEQDWIRTHAGSLTAAYNSSPFFPLFKDELLAIFALKPKFLVDLNELLNAVIIKRLKRNKRNSGSESACMVAPADFRNMKDLKTIRTILPPSPPYYQVFGDRFPFTPYLSWVDWLSNTGEA